MAYTIHQQKGQSKVVNECVCVSHPDTCLESLDRNGQ